MFAVEYVFTDSRALPLYKSRVSLLPEGRSKSLDPAHVAVYIMFKLYEIIVTSRLIWFQRVIDLFK